LKIDKLHVVLLYVAVALLILNYYRDITTFDESEVFQMGRDAELIRIYPTAELLQGAIDNGTYDYEDLSDSMKNRLHNELYPKD
jgi:hypothetical protein